MSDEIVPTQTQNPDAIDDLLQKGDFGTLTMRERSIFTYQLAKRLGLNPVTKPFDFIVLNNKLTLYANRSCADQLRKNNDITSQILYEGPLVIGETKREDVYCVRVRLMQQKEGQILRAEDAIGCVGITNKKDEELGNAIMKAHTKALRRGTLAFCGLGFLDEIEVDSVKGLEGGVGSPRRIVPEVASSFMPQESFDDTPTQTIPVIQPTPTQAPVPRPIPLAVAVPVAVAPKPQPAVPKLPSVLPAVKP